MSTPKPLVATEPLYIGSARAYNAGDLVPAEAAEENGWTEQCAKQGTKAADKASAPEPDAPAVETSTPAVSTT